MHEWFLDYCGQYPTFQPPFLILVTDTYQKIYIPGKLRTQWFFYSKNSHILIHLTDFSPGKFWSTGDFSVTNALTLELKLANKTS